MGLINKIKSKKKGAVAKIFSIKSIFYQLYYRYSKPKNGINKNVRKVKIIISLTTFPARVDSVFMTIKSLLNQNVKADKVVLYLGDDMKEGKIPSALKELEKYGLEIHYVSGNIKPHKKYFYAFEEYPNSVIITADDDIMYKRDFIKKLYQSYIRYPNAVSANRVHKMLKKDNKILSYNQWSYEDWSLKDSASMALFATGGAGALYPPGVITNDKEDMVNIEKYCLNADDVWLKFKEISNDIPVVWTGEKGFMEIKAQQHIRLAKTNAWDGKNDVYIKNMEHLTGIDLADYAEEQ